MNLRPHQLLEFLGVSREKLRYWRGVLPPLQDKAGNRRAFTPADVLALLVLRDLLESAGCSIAALRPCAKSLFELLNQVADWTALGPVVVIMDIERGKVILSPKGQRDSGQHGRLLISYDLTDGVASLKSYLLGVSSSPARKAKLVVLDRKTS